MLTPMALPQPNRRFPRFPVDLPVQVVSISPSAQVAVPGLVTEISQAGMSIYAGLPLQPGDVTEVVFQTPQVRLTGVIRSRDGFCYGLEFLALRKPTQRPTTQAVHPGAAEAARVLPEADRRAIEEAAAQDQSIAIFLRRHYEFLRRKQLEAKRLESEVASLRVAANLLREEAKAKQQLRGRAPGSNR